MKKILSHIPNAITCCNLLSGCFSIVMVMQGRLQWAAYMIFAAAVFDFLDGFSARLLKAFSPIGADLDSLSDMVSFGVAPGFIMLAFLSGKISPDWLKYTAFVLPVFSALRLAKFNIDSRQKTSFIGLPTPPMSIYVASLVLATQFQSNNMLTQWILNPWVNFALTLIFAGLMVSEIPFFSLKIKNIKWKDNNIRFLFLGVAVFLILIFGWIGISLAILLYIVVSLATQKNNKTV